MANITGNKNNFNSFQRLIEALRDNILRTIHVSVIAKVDKILDNGLYQCTVLGNNNIIQCNSINLTISANDVVIVLFTDNDYRDIINKSLLGLEVDDSNTKVKHSIDYGVIVGVLSKTTSED